MSNDLYWEFENGNKFSKTNFLMKQLKRILELW